MSLEKNGGRVPQLGLVCITHSDAVRYRTTTRKRLLTFDAAGQKRILRELYAANLQRLNRAIDFCEANDLRLYRITSGLFPFADDAAGDDVLKEFRDEARRTGERANRLGLRMILHPDQFVVLSSDSPEVIANSIKILSTHARVLDMLAQPRSAWAAMEIHGGKSGRAARLVEVIRGLPEEIRSRLALENDEYAYSAAEILEVCRAASVPMVFDAHHHVCRERLESYEDPSVAHFLAAARGTWPDPAWQLTHISNGRTAFNDRHHSDLITEMPAAYRDAPWIEVEAKHKELAIEKLRAEWLGGGDGKARRRAVPA
ncbi:MAG TPA: UV DNA damage repair endonuclease UvsE [Pyrinomonadaceae bacterium]|nr:UV DNA damage repair endonuclease UvsE [Pyrinomonadaceae bacterium]